MPVWSRGSQRFSLCRILLFPRSFRLLKTLRYGSFHVGVRVGWLPAETVVDKKRTFAVLSSALSQESHSSPGLFSGRDSLCFRRRVKSCRKSPFFVQVPDWPGVGKGQRGVASERADGLGRVGPRFALGLESAAGLGCTGPKCIAGLGGYASPKCTADLATQFLSRMPLVRQRADGFACGLRVFLAGWMGLRPLPYNRVTFRFRSERTCSSWMLL